MSVLKQSLILFITFLVVPCITNEEREEISEDIERIMEKKRPLSRNEEWLRKNVYGDNREEWPKKNKYDEMREEWMRMKYETVREELLRKNYEELGEEGMRKKYKEQGKEWLRKNIYDELLKDWRWYKAYLERKPPKPRKAILSRPRETNYFITATMHTFDSGLAACETLGGKMVIIHNEHEYNETLAVMEQCHDDYSYCAAYIGLKSVAGTYEFEWIDGSPANYTKWLPGHPVTPNLYPCVQMGITGTKYRNNPVGWASSVCTFEQNIACEKTT